MRVAWFGPAPREDHGVPNVATLLLRELPQYEIELDCFTVGRIGDLPSSLRETSGLNWFVVPTEWRWGSWYSRTPGLAFVTEQAARGILEQRLGRMIRREHGRRPYDLIYRFSAMETRAPGPRRAALPPLVLPPQVHAAGELRWHRVEDDLAARAGESRARRAAVRTMLRARARAQRR